jgi:hypothetical protein
MASHIGRPSSAYHTDAVDPNISSTKLWHNPMEEGWRFGSGGNAFFPLQPPLEVAEFST